MHKITKQIKEGEEGFEKYVKENYDIGLGYSDVEITFHKTALTILEAIRDMAGELNQKKKQELHAGYDDIDYMCAYDHACMDIKDQIDTIISEVKE